MEIDVRFGNSERNNCQACHAFWYYCSTAKHLMDLNPGLTAFFSQFRHHLRFFFSIPTSFVDSTFIAKVSLERRALGWVLFTAAQCGGVGFVPVSVDSVPFDYCEAPAQW